MNMNTALAARMSMNTNWASAFIVPAASTTMATDTIMLMGKVANTTTNMNQRTFMALAAAIGMKSVTSIRMNTNMFMALTVVTIITTMIITTMTMIITTIITNMALAATTIMGMTIITTIRPNAGKRTSAQNRRKAVGPLANSIWTR